MEFIQFTFWNKKNIYQREVYNFLDFLGDVGGLYDGLYYCGAIMLWVLQLLISNTLTSRVILKVFHKNSDPDRYQKLKSGCRCWLRCFQSRQWGAEYRLGSRMIDKDLEICTFLMRHRLVWEQFKSKFYSKTQYTKFKEKSKALKLDPTLDPLSIKYNSVYETNLSNIDLDYGS